MHRLRFGDSLHIFLHEFIEHLFHALGSWAFNFYLIAPLFHSNLPVAALIRHEQNVESVRVLSSNYRLRMTPYTLTSTPRCAIIILRFSLDPWTGRSRIGMRTY